MTLNDLPQSKKSTCENDIQGHIIWRNSWRIYSDTNWKSQVPCIKFTKCPPSCKIFKIPGNLPVSRFFNFDLNVHFTDYDKGGVYWFVKRVCSASKAQEEFLEIDWLIDLQSKINIQQVIQLNAEYKLTKIYICMCKCALSNSKC